MESFNCFRIRTRDKQVKTRCNPHPRPYPHPLHPTHPTVLLYAYVHQTTDCCMRLPLTFSIIADITVAFDGVIMFNNVNLNDGVRDVHFNQSISNTQEFLICFYHTLGKTTWVG